MKRLALPIRAPHVYGKPCIELYSLPAYHLHMIL